ncbi:hypothetical protein HK097_010877 [Rhizophlyctis rosea]|uniref:AB hydrolase-1 domain-containing protein n=1 Tax=Rhizophlyctis rosea TaxID=64517 RepID=A0AAD5SEY2_9FUNG|nr:hypothetical protein HK097_010877 [Rhizophlyctis rosea]
MIARRSHLEQWSEQIVHFAQCANVLAIDLCGHGKSDKPLTDAPYSPTSLGQDIAAILEIYKWKAEGFLLISHSYGCNILTLSYPQLRDHIKALIFICPKVRPSPAEQKDMDKFIQSPIFLVNTVRLLDRRGGTRSKSVGRYLAPGASEALRRRQLKWNMENETWVAKKLMKMALWATPEDYRKIDCPLLLIGGQEDRFTPVATNMDMIYSYMAGMPNIAEPFVIPNGAHQAMLEEPDMVNAITYNWLIALGFSQMDFSNQLIREINDPNNAKWNLKNYAKWTKTVSVSSIPVKSSLFRPMKTMQQEDPVHSPKKFAAQHPEIGLVIDISREAPPYVPEDFEGTTCTYRKLATTSKIPPTREEVKRFSEVAEAFWKENPGKHIAV